MREHVPRRVTRVADWSPNTVASSGPPPADRGGAKGSEEWPILTVFRRQEDGLSESAVIFLILVAIPMYLIGIKDPIRLLVYLFVLWLAWEIFFAEEPTRAARVLRDVLNNFIAFLKALI